MPDIALTVQKFPLAVIQPNPWQTRNGKPDPAYIAELADSIEADGLEQVPRGRVLDDDSIELLFGHNRLAAFRLLAQRHAIADDVPGRDNPFKSLWDEMPVEIVDATDEQMARAAIIENSKRRDLTAIEKALALQRYMTDFKKSQSEAGALFGLKTQGAVSNLLRLLKLPTAVQDLVSAGTLPERIARQLIPFASSHPQVMVTIAQRVAKADESKRDEKLDSELRVFYNDHGIRLFDPPWKSLKWPAQAISVDNNPAVSKIPACEGCPFAVQHKYGYPTCLSKPCYQAKTQAWVQAEAERVAKKLKVAVPAQAEKVTLIYTGEHRSAWDPVRALATKHASLRIVPAVPARENWDRDRNLDRVLGSKWVVLATTDAGALAKAMASVKLPKEAKALVERKQKLDRWETQRKKREEQRRKLLIRDRALIRAAAPHMARVLPTGALLQIIYNKVGFGITDSQRKAWPKASDSERQAILMECLLADHAHVTSYSAPEPARVATKVVTLAKQLKLKLPRGWNEVQQPKPSKNGKG